MTEEDEEVIRWPDEGSSCNEYDGIGEVEIPLKAVQAAETEEKEKRGRVAAFTGVFEGAVAVGSRSPESSGASQGPAAAIIAGQAQLTAFDVFCEGWNPARVTCEHNTISGALQPVAITPAVHGQAELRVALGARWQGQAEIFAISAAQVHSIRRGVQACAGGSAYGYATFPGSVVVAGTTQPYIGPSTRTLGAGDELRVQLIPAGGSGNHVVFSVPLWLLYSLHVAELTNWSRYWTQEPAN